MHWTGRKPGRKPNETKPSNGTMPTLTANGFSLQLTLTRADDGWIIYWFGIFCGAEPVLNYRIYSSISPTTPKKQRPVGCRAWSIDETLIPTLEWVLRNNQALSWQSTEPDAMLAVYPDDVFPLAPTHHQLLVAGDDESPFDHPRPSLDINQVKVYDTNGPPRVDRPPGPRPSVGFCVILRFNSHKFVGGSYTSTGPALILQTNRREFTRFVRELKREYKQVPKRKQKSRPKIATAKH